MPREPPSARRVLPRAIEPAKRGTGGSCARREGVGRRRRSWMQTTPCFWRRGVSSRECFRRGVRAHNLRLGMRTDTKQKTTLNAHTFGTVGKTREPQKSRHRTLRSASFSRERSGKARDVTRADIDWRDALRTTARTFIARRRRLPRGSNSRPGEHEQRRVRVDLAPIAHRAHRFVPAHRCAPPQLPQLRRGGQARSPGDARRRRGRGARHRRRAADQGGPRGLPALGMQAQGAVEVRARRCRSATHDVASGFSAPSEAARPTRFQSRVSGNATQPPFSRTDKTEKGYFSSPKDDAYRRDAPSRLGRAFRRAF
jgi:hypothetical protein